MRIAILGAGGLGGQLGAALHEAGHDVHLVARGEHLKALKLRGLELIDRGARKTLRLPSSSGNDLPRGVDIAFVTVKSYALAGVAPLATQLADSGAWIVPLVNGVDAVEQLTLTGVPAGQLAAGVAYVTAFRTAPGTVERQGDHQRLAFGNLPPLPDGKHPLSTAFDGTGITVHISADIHVELWRKMAVVCALAAVCGVAGAALGVARRTAEGRRLQIGTVSEVLTVGRTRGVALELEDDARTHAILDGFADDFFPSLLHDLRQGQRTEVEALNGTISDMGREAGIKTPCNDFATDAIRASERAATAS